MAGPVLIPNWVNVEHQNMMHTYLATQVYVYIVVVIVDSIAIM